MFNKQIKYASQSSSIEKQLQTRSYKEKRSCKIMIIEKSILISRALNLLLNTQPDFDVLDISSSGLEAINKLRLMPWSCQPDVILVSFDLPKMDGIDFLIRARQKARSKIIMLTSKTINSQHQEFKQAMFFGAHAIIKKPSNITSLFMELKLDQGIVHTIRTTLNSF